MFILGMYREVLCYKTTEISDLKTRVRNVAVISPKNYCFKWYLH